MSYSNSHLVSSSDGTHIYADAVGDPANPSIVFIHGYTLSAAVFDNIFSNPKYSRDFYLVRYDTRGHGRSGKPDTIEGYASKLFADDFAAVLRTFKIRKPVVVGWSLGATVIADIAAHLPWDTMAGAVYLAGLPYIDPDVMQHIGSPFILGLLPTLMSTEEDLTRVSQATLEFSDSLFLNPRKIPWETRCHWMGMSLYQQPIHRIFVLSRPQDPQGLFDLGMQGLPVLVVNGTRDTQVDGEAVATELKRHFVDVELRLIEKGGSHAVHYENCGEVMESVMAFATRVESEATECPGLLAYKMQ